MTPEPIPTRCDCRHHDDGHHHNMRCSFAAEPYVLRTRGIMTDKPKTKPPRKATRFPRTIPHIPTVWQARAANA